MADRPISDLPLTENASNNNDFLIINKTDQNTHKISMHSFVNTVPPAFRYISVSQTGGTRDNPAIAWLRPNTPTPNDPNRLLNCKYGFYTDGTDFDPDSGQPGRGRASMCEVLYTDQNQEFDGADIWSVIRDGNQTLENRKYDFVFEKRVKTITGPGINTYTVERDSAENSVATVDVHSIAEKLNQVIPTISVNTLSSLESYDIVGSEIQAVDSAFVSHAEDGSICVKYNSLTVALIAAFKSERQKRLELETQMQQLMERVSALES